MSSLTGFQCGERATSPISAGDNESFVGYYAAGGHMIIFGTAGGSIQLGDAGVQLCPICREPTQHSLVLRYRYFHLYYFMGAVTSRQYLRVCHRCRNGAVIARKDLPSNIAQPDPIPFMRKYGLLVGGGIVLAGALLICFVLLTFAIK